MPALSLRRATPVDAPALADLHVAVWRSAYVGLLPDSFLSGLLVADRLQRWQQILATGSETLLAELDGSLVGFSAAGPSRDEGATAGSGELYALYVSADVWGSGVGRALHDEAVGRLVAAGCTTATLWVLEGNTRARSFYARQGWEPDGVTKTEEWPGATAQEVRLARRLQR